MAIDLTSRLSPSTIRLHLSRTISSKLLALQISRMASSSTRVKLCTGISRLWSKTYLATILSLSWPIVNSPRFLEACKSRMTKSLRLDLQLTRSSSPLLVTRKLSNLSTKWLTMDQKPKLLKKRRLCSKLLKHQRQSNRSSRKSFGLNKSDSDGFKISSKFSWQV